MCVGVTEGVYGNGCDLASTLCKYNLRKRDLFVLSWARVRRAANVGWRCALYCVITSCG